MPSKRAPDQGSGRDGLTVSPYSDRSVCRYRAERAGISKALPDPPWRGAEKNETMWYTVGMNSRTDTDQIRESHAAEPSLMVTRGDTVVFSHHGSWLHPLFELESFLIDNGMNAAGLTLSDKIIGKAAAMLITGMGFTTVHGRLMSRLAAEFFKARGVRYTHDALVERVACRTEELLAEVNEIEPARRMLYERAGRPIPDRV
jgi:hypothetical protein